MKAYWGLEVQLHSFLKVTLYKGECSASCPGRFIRRQRAPPSDRACVAVNPRAGLEESKKTNLFSPGRKSKSDPSISQPVDQSLYYLRYFGWPDNIKTDLKGWPRGGSANSVSIKEFINQMCYCRIGRSLFRSVRQQVVKVDVASSAPVRWSNATSLPASGPKRQDAAVVVPSNSDCTP
jgi:hypothetical protein